jgi:hypothetical protein
MEVKMQEPEEQLNSGPPAEAVGGEEQCGWRLSGKLLDACMREGIKASGERVLHQRRGLETSCRGDLGQGQG